MSRIILDLMRWSWLVLPAALLLTNTTAAQNKPKPKPEEKPEDWNSLDVEPDKPEPPPPPPKPKPPANQYAPVDPEPAEPAPRPTPSNGEKQIVTENTKEAGSSLPESVLWMKQWKPRFLVRHVRADFDVWDHAGGTNYMWNIVMALGVEDVPVLLDIELPFTHWDLPDGSDPGAHTHFGNATFGLHGGGVIADAVGLWGGAWVGIPSAKDINNIDATTTFLASYSRNFVDFYRYLPNAIPLRLGFGIDGQLFPLVYLRSSLFSTIIFPNEKLEGNISIPGTLEQSHEVEALSPIGLGGGLRFASVFNPFDDRFVEGGLHALEPFISYQPPYEGPFAFDLFARIGFLFGLNTPAALNDVPFLDKPFTITMQVGYRF